MGFSLFHIDLLDVCDTYLDNFWRWDYYYLYWLSDELLDGPEYPKCAKAIQLGIDSVNQGATSNAQKVQKWHILKKDFSVPGGELGPTLKVKRHVVSKIYTDTIEKIYRWILKDWFACWFVFIVNKSIFSMQKIVILLYILSIINGTKI